MADVTDKVAVLWVFIYNICIKIAAILMVVLHPSCYWLEALIRTTSIAVHEWTFEIITDFSEIKEFWADDMKPLILLYRQLTARGSWLLRFEITICVQSYRVADKSLARPGREQAAPVKSVMGRGMNLFG